MSLKFGIGKKIFIVGEMLVVVVSRASFSVCPLSVIHPRTTGQRTAVAGSDYDVSIMLTIMTMKTITGVWDP